MKKITVSKVQRVPSFVNTIDDLHPTGFSSYLWCDLRFNVHSRCTPGFENEFVDVETFKMMLLKFRRKLRSLLLLLMLEVLPLNLPLHKMRLLPKLLESWR
jgi:hypothetical protein